MSPGRLAVTSTVFLASVASAAVDGGPPAAAPPMTSLALCAVALVAALVAHLALTRLARRVPLLLARALGGADAVARGVHLRWQGPIAALFLIPKALVWIAAFHFIGRLFPLVDQDTDQALEFVRMSFTKSMFMVNGRDYSALDVVLLPASLGVLWVAVGALTRVVQAWLARSAPAESGARDAIGILARYVITFLGAVVVLQVWGIDLRSIAIVASVLGVGIGFGLQHMANNFISGLVISLERPVRPGDFVTVAGLTGVVQRIGGRSAEIRTLDQVTILVPNSKFLETEVINWNHGHPTSRLHLPVGVAYGSDLRAVRSALLAAARSHPEVLAEPRPDVHFLAFGDNAISLELLVWTADPSRQTTLTSDLYFRLDAELRRRGIEVPFPQRDLRVRSPQLERALELWLKRELGDAASAESGAQPSPERREFTDFLDVEEPDDRPRAWSDVELDVLVARMRGPGGVHIVDRRHLLRTYPKCFVGSEVVDWLARWEGLSRAEATRVGQLLVDRGRAHHVLDEHPFRDGRFFYRFHADEKADAAGL